MTQEAQEPVAVIGLGSMGMGVAQSLIRAGMRVSGFDTAGDVLAKFAEGGGRAAPDPAEAARDAVTAGGLSERAMPRAICSEHGVGHEIPDPSGRERVAALPDDVGGRHGSR